MTESSDRNFLKKAVVTNANTVGTVLMTGAGLAGIILLVKVTGSDEFRFFDAEYPVIHAWFLFTLFTFAHWYTAILLVRSTSRLRMQGDAELCREAWLDVAATGSLFVRGAVAQMRQHPTIPNLWLRDRSNPSVVFTLTAVAGMMLAIIPFDLIFVALGYRTFFWSQVVSCLVLLAGAFFFAIVNWMIGGNWLVRLAQLSNLSDSSLPP